MASVKEYFELDFNHTIRISGKISGTYIDKQFAIVGYANCDFISNSIFISCYFEGTDLPFEFFVDFLKILKKTWLNGWQSTGTVRLPSSNLNNGIKVFIK